MDDIKILIVSGARLESQANADVRTAIMRGWVDIIGAKNVGSVDLRAAPQYIEIHNPTILLAIGSYLPESIYFTEVTKLIRERGGINVFWATEDPYEHDAHYRIIDDFDIIYSCDRNGSKFYNHKEVYHLPLAACPHAHYIPISDVEDRDIDIAFCGVAFGSRKLIISELLPHLRLLNIKIIGPGWGEFGSGFSDERIDSFKLMKIYSQSKFVLNIGRSLHFENKRHVISPSTPGPRTFEAALAGAAQIFHEDTYEIFRFFNKTEILTFSSVSEFNALIDRYINDPLSISQLRHRAQDRALADHLYSHRAREVLEKIIERGVTCS